MDESALQTASLSRRAKVWGTLFLLFQLLFAANNYGPHRIPGLHLFFDAPWVAHVDRHDRTPTATAPFALRDVTEAAGLTAFRRAPFRSHRPHYLEVMGGGVAVGDYDNDGWDDVLLTSLPAFGDRRARDRRAHEMSSTTLFRNRGNGTFVDVTAEVGLDAIAGYPQGALFFDFDNDGDSDLYVAAYRGGQLFRNEEGRYEEITAEAGLALQGRCGALPCFASSASAADYNRDGWLDLLIVNNVAWDLEDPAHHGERRLFPAFFAPQPALLFRNNGDGTFTDVTRAAGMANAEGKGLSAVWLHLNQDRWPDVYVANDLSRNALYYNNGDGTFTEVASGAGVDEIKSSMGVAAGDTDHNGHMDLITTNLRGSKVSLFRNQGGLHFDYATNYAGLGSSRRASGWGIAFADLDLDGHLDLAVSGGALWEAEDGASQNLFFRNRGDGRFEQAMATPGSTRNSYTSRGLAVLDADHSGSPDLLFANVDGAAPQLLTSHPPAANNWLKVRLEGTASNRDGVGARVIVARTDSLRLVQEVRAGGSYQSTSTKTLFFGLGSAKVASVRVQWPSGIDQQIHRPAMNQTLYVTERSLIPTRGPQNYKERSR